jgi:hypothetical protein
VTITLSRRTAGAVFSLALASAENNLPVPSFIFYTCIFAQVFVNTRDLAIELELRSGSSSCWSRAFGDGDKAVRRAGQDVNLCFMQNIMVVS